MKINSFFISLVFQGDTNRTYINGIQFLKKKKNQSPPTVENL